MRSVRVTTGETGTVRGTARRPHFSLAIISVTVQLRIWVFWVISVYFNVRNILPESGTFPPDTLYIHNTVATERSLKVDRNGCAVTFTLTERGLSRQQGHF